VYLRRRPEDHGLLPDGDEPTGDGQDTGHPRPATEVRWSLREAMHVRAFWLLTLITATGMFGQTAANLHAVANFQDGGMSDTLAFTIPAVFAGVSAISTFPWGFAIERIGGRLAMLIIAVMNVLGMAAIITADSYPAAVLYAAVAGVAGGGFLVAQRLIWADYFGRYSVGTIRGVSSLFIGVLGTMGPLMAGWLRDTTGDYTLAFTITAAVFAVGFVAMLFAPAPKKPAPAL
jgi:MFS family permease